MDDDEALRTPTRSEIDTFKILANPEFASIRKNEPTSQSLNILGHKGLKSLPEDDSASESSHRSRVIGRGRNTPQRTPEDTPERPERQRQERPSQSYDDSDSETPRRSYASAPRGATSRLRNDSESVDEERNSREDRDREGRNREDREGRDLQDREGSVDTEVPAKDYYAFGAGGVQEGDGPAIASRINAPKTISPEDLKRLKAEAAAEIAIEKEALLYEIELLEKQGLIKLQRRLTMEDSLDSIQ